MTQTNESNPSIITSIELLEHWQGHRRLTRKLIQAFPEEKLFSYSVGGMRPFADIARELIGLAGRSIHGIATGNWDALPELNYHDTSTPISQVNTKDELLKLWDNVTEEMDNLWPQIPEGRFRETDTAWGMYEGEVCSHLFYFVDNENHHRGQGYVYLRSMGIEPPYFWDRD
jgi:uncharacterized damage-inducible protein DinB